MLFVGDHFLAASQLNDISTIFRCKGAPVRAIFLPSLILRSDYPFPLTCIPPPISCTSTHQRRSHSHALISTNHKTIITMLAFTGLYLHLDLELY